MAKKSNFWYILVMTDNGPVFVTKINYMDRTAEWNVSEKPLEMSKAQAQDIAMGLTLNFSMAYAVCQSWKIEDQPYLYNRGKFVWQFNVDEEEDDESDNNA